MESGSGLLRSWSFPGRALAADFSNLYISPTQTSADVQLYFRRNLLLHITRDSSFLSNQFLLEYKRILVVFSSHKDTEQTATRLTEKYFIVYQNTVLQSLLKPFDLGQNSLFVLKCRLGTERAGGRKGEREGWVGKD